MRKDLSSVVIGEIQQVAHTDQVSREREREISVIYDLSRRLSYTLDLDSVLKTTAALARRMLSSEGALVFMVEDGRPVLKAALGSLPFSDVSSIHLPRENWAEQLQRGDNVIAEKVSLSWLPLPAASSLSSHNLAAVPLFTGSEISGYLICFSPPERDFKESHLDVLSTLASQAGVAVEKSRLYTLTVAEKSKLETILSALRDGLLVTDSSGALLQASLRSKAWRSWRPKTSMPMAEPS